MTTQIVDVNQTKLWTSVAGSGPAMVLCHGGPGHFDNMGPVSDMVDDLVTVYRYDQRGCGRSMGAPPYDVDTFVDDLEALRKHWGLDKWIVAGVSWGGCLALAYCVKYPHRAKALISINSPGIVWDWHDQFKERQLSRLLPEELIRLDELKIAADGVEGKQKLGHELLRLLYPADLADRGNAHLFDSHGFFDFPMNWQVNRRVNADWVRLGKSGEMQKQAANLQMPALIIHGEEDPRPLSIAADLNQLIAGSELAPLPGVGHFPWLENPHLLENSLRSFLQKVV